MVMSIQRQQEIALKYVQHKLRTEGIGSLEANNMRRRVLATAKAINIDSDEAMEFARLIVQQAVDLAFAESYDS